MKRLIVVLTLILTASVARAENMTKHNEAISNRILNFIIADKEPILKNCKEVNRRKITLLRMVKSFV